MKPYFYKLNKHLIGDEAKAQLIDLAFKNIEQFNAYVGKATGQKDGNCYYTGALFRECEELVSLVARCSIFCYPLFMLHHPYTKVPKHMDDKNHRNCILVTPLFPQENYAPTRFWETLRNFEEQQKQESSLLAVCDFSDTMPVLLNTQVVHDLETKEGFRLNLQLCFNEPFEVVAELIEQDRLFKAPVV